MLDAHSDPQIPAATDLRHIILAGGLFAVLASNEGSVECMPPERRPAAAFPACCSREEESVTLGQRPEGACHHPVYTYHIEVPRRILFYKTEIKLKPHWLKTLGRRTT